MFPIRQQFCIYADLVFARHVSVVFKVRALSKTAMIGPYVGDRVFSGRFLVSLVRIAIVPDGIADAIEIPFYRGLCTSMILQIQHVFGGIVCL
jgi:hypothetical protein